MLFPRQAAVASPSMRAPGREQITVPDIKRRLPIAGLVLTVVGFFVVANGRQEDVQPSDEPSVG